MGTDHLFKLAHEYRPTMDHEILHDWAREICATITGDGYTPCREEWTVYDRFANHRGTVYADCEMSALAKFDDSDDTWRAIRAADMVQQN